jgi:hypothetical protein
MNWGEVVTRAQQINDRRLERGDGFRNGGEELASIVIALEEHLIEQDKALESAINEQFAKLQKWGEGVADRFGEANNRITDLERRVV